MTRPNTDLLLTEARIARVATLPLEDRRHEVATFATALYDQLGADALLGFGQNFEQLYYAAANPKTDIEPAHIDIFAAPYLEALMEQPDLDQAYRAGRKVHKWRQVPFGKGSIDQSPLTNMGILALHNAS